MSHLALGQQNHGKDDDDDAVFVHSNGQRCRDVKWEFNGSLMSHLALGEQKHVKDDDIGVFNYVI